MGPQPVPLTKRMAEQIAVVALPPIALPEQGGARVFGHPLRHFSRLRLL